jgi:hypothetical protein
MRLLFGSGCRRKLFDSTRTGAGGVRQDGCGLENKAVTDGSSKAKPRNSMDVTGHSERITTELQEGQVHGNPHQVWYLGLAFDRRR